MLFAVNLHAQSINILPGDIEYPTRITLVSNWGDVDHEIGYCITNWHYDSTTYSASVFDTLTPAKVIMIDSVGPKIIGKKGSVIVSCAKNGTPILHTHINRMCAPSNADSIMSLTNHHPFDVIQCDADAFVFFHVNVPQYSYSSNNAMIYGALSVGVLFANEVWQFDTDVGGYPNKWYIEKQGLHFAIASTLTFAASAAHVNPWIAAGITCGSGAVYEKTQGYVNSKDIIADCSGAFITAAFVKLFERKH